MEWTRYIGGWKSSAFYPLKTTRELAWELDVSRRAIMNDIIALSFDYPIYTKPGEDGGVFITENYKPCGRQSSRKGAE